MCVPDEERERESSWKIRVKTFLIKIIPRKAIQRTFSCTFKCCPLFPSTNTNDNNIKLYSCTLSTINIQIGIHFFLFSCSIVFLYPLPLEEDQLNSSWIYMRPQIDDKPFARSFVPSSSWVFLYLFGWTFAEPLSIISSLTKSDDD